MPIHGHQHVATTLREFTEHWTRTNAALGATPLTLSGGYTLANLTADRDSIVSLTTAIVVAENGREVVAADRNAKRVALRERLRQLRAALAGRLAGTVFAVAVPRVPKHTVSESEILRALDDAKEVWTRANASLGANPLILSGGYTLASFTTDLAALRAAFAAVTAADQALRMARRQRDLAEVPIKGRLVQYRRAVAGSFPLGHALIESLPAASPRYKRKPKVA